MKKTFMGAAAGEAREGIKLKHGGPFGAVVIKDGKIIGRGHNTVVRDNDPTAHGEVNAIRDACKNMNTFDLSGAQLFTTCYPCPMCMGAILWAHIDKVYYACDSKDAEGIGFSDDIYYDFFADKEKIEKLLIKDGESLPDCRMLFKEYAESEKTLY